MGSRLLRQVKLLVFILLLISGVAAVAAPEMDLMPYWSTNNPESNVQIDHTVFDKWLAKYVEEDNGITYVKYAAVDLEARNLLKSYIYDLESIKVTNYNLDEQKAYWINLYNAETLLVVLNHYPVRSIREITFRVGLLSGLTAVGPWSQKLVTVEGHSLSLDDIEHRIVRPVFNDARVHYALNCASLGCPNLQKRAYVGHQIEAQLDKAASDFVNSARGVKIIKEKLKLSKIYDWYRKDFGGMKRAIIANVRKYAKPELNEKLGKFTTFRTLKYDWRLNDFKRVEAIREKQRKEEKRKRELDKIKRNRRLELEAQRLRKEQERREAYEKAFPQD